MPISSGYHVTSKEAQTPLELDRMEVDIYVGISPSILFIRRSEMEYEMKSDVNTQYSGAGTAYRRVGLSLFVMCMVAVGFQILVFTVLVLLQNSGHDYTNLSWMMWLATFLPIYGAAVPVYLAMMGRLPVETAQPTQLGGKNFWILFLMCIPIMYGGNILGTLLSHLLSRGTAENGIATYISDTSLLKVLVIVVLAPLLEELVFRKQIIDRCGRYGEKTAILFSALAFGLFHMNLFQFFYAFGLGLIFAYVYTRTRRLRYPVIMHMMINFNGSVLAPWILTRVDQEALQQISSGAMDEVAIEEALLGLALFGGYALLLLGLSIAGLVLLIVRARKFVFLPTSEELPRGKHFQTIYCNVGVILFVAFCIGMCVYSLVA